MPQYANAILTKARAMYGRRISPVQYSELLRKQTVQEISAFLRERTTYAHALVGVQDSAIHRGQLEALLSRELLYEYTRLAHYVPTNGRVYDFVVREAEMELVLSRLGNIISQKKEEFMAHLPVFLKSFISFDMFSLADAESVDQIATVLRHSPLGPVFARCAAHNPQQGSHLNYAAYEFELRCFYFRQLLKGLSDSMSRKTREQLELLIKTRAEMTNLNNIYRMKSYFSLPPAEIRRTVMPFCARIRPKVMEQLIEAKDPQDFMRLLAQETPYKRQVDVNSPFIEGQTDQIRLDLDRRLMRFSTSPEVVYTSFMLLKQMELENITRIIEGVRYKVPAEKIESLLYKI